MRDILLRAGQSRNLSRVFFLLLCGFAVVCALRTPHHDLDFKVYYKAAQKVLDHDSNLYDVSDKSGWAYRYGAIFAVLIAPLALLSANGAIIVWSLLNGVALVASWLLAERIVRTRFAPNGLSFGARLLTLVMFLDPISRNAIQGNVNVIMFFCAVAALVSADERRSIAAGFFLALGTVTKIYPGALLIYFVAKKDINVVISILLWMIAFIVVVPGACFGFSQIVPLLHGWMAVLTDHSYYDILMPENQSPLAVAWRLSGSETFGTITLGICVFGCLAVCVWLAFKRDLKKLALFTLAMPVLCLSNAFTCYFIVTMPLIMAINVWLCTGQLSKREQMVWGLRFTIVHLFVVALLGRGLAVTAQNLGQHFWGFLLAVMIFALGPELARGPRLDERRVSL